jgi:mono/diheme cytochrome c family protein
MHETPPTSTNAAIQPRLAGMLAEFYSPEELRAAARLVRDEGYRQWDAYSPFPVHGLERAMGIRPTILPWLVFLGGVAGGVAGLGMQIYTNSIDYPYITSGKPLLSIPAFIPITFETIVLFAAITAFLAALLLSGLPRFWHPAFSSRRFQRVTTDGFFIGIESRDPHFSETTTRDFLQSLGAKSVEAMYDPADAGRLPTAVYWAAAILFVLALIPPLWIAQSRVTTSATPKLNLITDMDYQAHLRPQEAAAASLFADRRAARPDVPGTVARANLRLDDHLYRGRTGDQWATEFPMEVTAAMMARGQERFNVYCAPCHGYDGNGKGSVSERAIERQYGTWVPPVSLHVDAVRQQAVGQVYNTITHGIRKMPPYGSQIPVHDRWAIVLYVQALQRSQRAGIDDVPPDRRDELR